MNADYDKNTRTLKLTKTGKANDGIVVQNGAKIYGDKNVAFASDNINIYKGLGGSVGKKICLQCGRHGFNPWVGKIL